MYFLLDNLNGVYCLVPQICAPCINLTATNISPSGIQYFQLHSGFDFLTNHCKFLYSFMHYSHYITIEPGKRSGQACIRGMRITVNDILNWLASGKSIAEILEDYDELTKEDIFAALQYAADREGRHHMIAI